MKSQMLRGAALASLLIMMQPAVAVSEGEERWPADLRTTLEAATSIGHYTLTPTKTGAKYTLHSALLSTPPLELTELTAEDIATAQESGFPIAKDIPRLGIRDLSAYSGDVTSDVVAQRSTFRCYNIENDKVQVTLATGAIFHLIKLSESCDHSLKWGINEKVGRARVAFAQARAY